jgi:hypothetical protein
MTRAGKVIPNVTVNCKNTEIYVKTKNKYEIFIFRSQIFYSNVAKCHFFKSLGENPWLFPFLMIFLRVTSVQDGSIKIFLEREPEFCVKKIFLNKKTENVQNIWI